MYDEYTDDMLLRLREDYLANFHDQSPFMRVNKGYFFQCYKSIEEELIKRGVLVNEED